MIRNRYNYLTPSVPRHQRERRTHLKQRRHNQNSTSRKPKGQFLSQKIGQTTIQNKTFTRRYMQRHTMTEIVNHSRSIALESSVKTLNRCYMATTLALTSAVVYTRYLFNPREGFLTHQCSISENIKIKRIQKWNNNEDSTARNNWNAEAKENRKLDSGGPDHSKSIRHQPTYLKVLRPEPS